MAPVPPLGRDGDGDFGAHVAWHDRQAEPVVREKILVPPEILVPASPELASR
jgi:hypothetical protein